MGTDSPSTHWTHGGETVLSTWSVTFESTDTADVHQILANWLHQLGSDAIDVLCSSLGFTADGAVTLTVCYQPYTPATGPARSITHRPAQNPNNA